MDKKLYIRKGARLFIECLSDAQTGMGYFLIKDEQGNASRAAEIVAEGVTYSANQKTRNVYHLPDGTWMESKAYMALMSAGGGRGADVVEIPADEPLPQNLPVN